MANKVVYIPPRYTKVGGKRMDEYRKYSLAARKQKWKQQPASLEML